MSTFKVLLFLVLMIFQSHGEDDDSGEEDECSKYQFKCGNICISNDPFRVKCTCGNVTLGKYSRDYCCMNPEDTCTQESEENGAFL